MRNSSGHAELLERFYEDACSRGDTEVLDVVLADSTGTDPTNRVPADREAVKLGALTALGAIPADPRRGRLMGGPRVLDDPFPTRPHVEPPPVVTAVRVAASDPTGL